MKKKKPIQLLRMQEECWINTRHMWEEKSLS